MSALECYLITNAPIVLDNYPIIPCVFFIVVIIPLDSSSDYYPENGIERGRTEKGNKWMK